jgi:predicted nuclease of restriction endonuclease-like (RecB) superfamily
VTVDDSDTFPVAAPSGQQIAATADYVALRDAIVERAAAARERAARAVNTELVLLYWSIGRAILTEQQRHSWGDDVVGLLAQDLRALGDLGRGFSRRNLFYMRQFAALWPDEQIVQTLSAQIGWSHHQVLLNAFGDAPDLYAWYAAKAVENRWAVRQLRGQIDLKLHLRAGAATANYAATLGEIEGRAALAVTKDPYVLDFIDLAENAKERQLEDALVRDIPHFLRELGVGFAYYGRQQPLEIGDREFFLDLLFYHHRLRRFVLVDLKIGEFKAEFAGKIDDTGPTARAPRGTCGVVPTRTGAGEPAAGPADAASAIASAPASSAAIIRDGTCRLYHRASQAVNHALAAGEPETSGETPECRGSVFLHAALRCREPRPVLEICKGLRLSADVYPWLRHRRSRHTLESESRARGRSLSPHFG